MIEAAGTDRFRFEIYGTQGTIWLRTGKGPLAVFSGEGTAEKGWHSPELPAVSPGERQHRRWVDGLLGRAAPEATAVAGLRGLLVAEAIAHSSERGGCREPVAVGSATT
jgi:predicted dehydrogenase